MARQIRYFLNPLRKVFDEGSRQQSDDRHPGPGPDRRVARAGFSATRSSSVAKQKVPFRVIFEGSASGLRKGGSVNFAGIRVGEVVSLKLDHPRRVVALAMIDGNTPVKSDTQVGLEFQGLTGIAAISFTGGSDEAPPPKKGADGIPELTADPDGTLNTQEKIRVALRNVDKVIADNEAAVKDTLRNFESFTASLSGNGAKISSIIATAEDGIAAVDGALDKTRDFLGRTSQRQIWRRVAADRDLDARADRKLRQEIRQLSSPTPARCSATSASPSTQANSAPARRPRPPDDSFSIKNQKNGNARRARQIHRCDRRPARHRDPHRKRRAAAFAKISLARRFRADCAAPDSEIPLRLHLRRRRDRRRAARQPQGLRRIRLRAARAQRRLRPRPDHDAVRQDLRLAVRHSADGLLGAVRLSRRHRADAGRKSRKRADDSQRLVADHAGGRARRQPGRVVPGLSRRPPRADRAAGRSRGGGRLRHLRRHRRRAGAAEPREQHPQRLSGAARDHAARVLGHGHASALAVRHLGAHREEFRHAAFREHGRQARPAGAGEKPDAQYRPSRPARLEACRTDPQEAGRASSSSRDWSRRRMRASRARAASTA